MTLASFEGKREGREGGKEGRKEGRKRKDGGKKSSLYPQSAQLCKLQSPNLAKFRKLASRRPQCSFLANLKKMG